MSLAIMSFLAGRRKNGAVLSSAIANGQFVLNPTAPLILRNNQWLLMKLNVNLNRNYTNYWDNLWDLLCTCKELYSFLSICLTSLVLRMHLANSVSEVFQKVTRIKGAVGLRTNWPFAIAEESIAPFFSATYKERHYGQRHSK